MFLDLLGLPIYPPPLSLRLVGVRINVRSLFPWSRFVPRFTTELSHYFLALAGTVPVGYLHTPDTELSHYFLALAGTVPVGYLHTPDTELSHYSLVLAGTVPAEYLQTPDTELSIGIGIYTRLSPFSNAEVQLLH